MVVHVRAEVDTPSFVHGYRIWIVESMIYPTGLGCSLVRIITSSALQCVVAWVCMVTCFASRDLYLERREAAAVSTRYKEQFCAAY